MPKPSSVSPAMVTEIADEILIGGEFPSINRIQQELRLRNGTSGSTLVVTRLLSEWKTTVALKIRNDASSRPQSELDHLAAALANQASKVAAEAFDERIQAMSNTHEQALNALRSDLQVAHEKHLEVSDRLRQSHERSVDLAQTISTLSEENTALANTIRLLEQQNTASIQAIETLTHENSALSASLIEENQRAEDRLSLLGEQHANALQSQAYQHQIQLAELVKTHSSELAKKQDDHEAALQVEAERTSDITKKFMLFVDQQRTKDKNHQDSLSELETKIKGQAKKEADKAQKTIDSLSSQLQTERLENAKNVQSLRDLYQKIQDLPAIIQQNQKPVMPVEAESDASLAGQKNQGTNND